MSGGEPAAPVADADPLAKPAPTFDAGIGLGVAEGRTPMLDVVVERTVDVCDVAHAQGHETEPMVVILL